MSELGRRTLGTSGIEVPVVGLGTNNFGRRLDEAASRLVIDAALDAGVTFFDTADIYGGGHSEEFIGRALKGRRDEVVIATKFGYPGEEGSGGSPRWIAFAIERSLRRLQVDHVDLYQHHVPDATVPLEETLGALHDLVVAGKVRAIGCSQYTGELAEQAAEVARRNGWTQFATAQNQYSLLHREEVESSIGPVAKRLRMGLLPFFPLENGLLTGKYRRGQDPPPGSRLGTDAARAADFLTDAKFDVVEALQRFATARGIRLLDVAIGGLAALEPVTSVIAGATTAEQVRANARAGIWEPDAEDLAEIDRITLGRPAG
ncbi:MAG: aldo/keto reductase [Candidatus Dormibacteria bacterium]